MHKAAYGVLAMALWAISLIGAGIGLSARAEAVDPPSTQREHCSAEFAAVGASFTEMGAPDVDNRPGTFFDEAMPGQGSWAYWTDQDAGLNLTGGYARGGATTWEIAGMTEGYHVKPGSFLVILLGTNNLLRGNYDYGLATGNLDAIIARASVPRDKVLVVALPPLDRASSRVAPYNRALRDWAARSRIQFNWGADHMDDGTGRFKPGMSYDGIHLQQGAARVLGESIAAHLNAMSGCGIEGFSAKSSQLGGSSDNRILCGFRDGGCFQEFPNGSVYRSSSSPVAAVHSVMRAAWGSNSWENGRWGYPTGDTVPGLRNNGQRQEFQGGTAYAYGAGRNGIVTGAIRSRYLSIGAQNGPLGYPKGAESCGLRNGGCYQHFEGGSIYWTARTGAYWVRGAIADHWVRNGAQNGALGYPTSDEFCGLRDGGCATRFEGGIVYWSLRTGAHNVTGETREHYARHGFENGIGYPTGAKICGLRDGGCFQPFQSGVIYWSPQGGANVIQGPIQAAWNQQRWENGPMGYPVDDEVCGLRDNGCSQRFERGRIYWSPASGGHWIRGAIYDRWAQMGAERSPLGYPTSSEICTSNGCNQSFQTGAMSWTMAGGVVVRAR